MKEVNIYELVEKFNNSYAGKFPNYKLLIEAHHMVSYMGPTSIRNVGTYTDVKLAADKVEQLIKNGKQAWVSEISHILVLHNIKSAKTIRLNVYTTRPHVWCGGSPRNYKRYRASLKNYLYKELQLVPFDMNQLLSALDKKFQKPESMKAISCYPINQGELIALTEFVVANDNRFTTVEQVKLYMVQNRFNIVYFENGVIGFASSTQGEQLSAVEFIAAAKNK